MVWITADQSQINLDFSPVRMRKRWLLRTSYMVYSCYHVYSSSTLKWGRFLPLGQTILFRCTGVRTGCHYLIRLSVCVRVCNIRRFYWLRELHEADFHKPGIYGSGRVWANAWDVVFRAPSRGCRGRWDDVGFVVCSRWGGIFSFFPWVCIFKFVDPEQSASNRWRGSDSQLICPPRTCAHPSPPGVPSSVLAPQKYGVIS